MRDDLIKAIETQDLKKANGELKKCNLQPLDLFYTQSQAANLQQLFAQEGILENWESYLQMTKDQKKEYCDTVTEEVKKLRVIGVKMLINLVSGETDKKELSETLKHYKNSGQIDRLNEKINDITQNKNDKVNCTDNPKKDAAYTNAINLIKNAKEIDDALHSSTSLNEFIKNAEGTLRRGESTLKETNPLNQKIKSCFDAIRKAIYSVTRCDFVLSNEQKEKMTVQSMKAEINKLKEVEPASQREYSYS
ncbi:hypothetical protein [Legionella cincinnatiensis]|uniref:Uncharacterized protein n=1 Tax=Legionella cincinnatiensis TaxID=28085 RepID=A0A378IG06_9GAMM|nr:hypothetical protein [Legionella cincinnatiensis]KTC86845.1 hypothetical protein Lcin_1627 [Legionella cincinnatiensis]STX33963.1 Uncharacterised protein [Legionella cincinnatiensis]